MSLTGLSCIVAFLLNVGIFIDALLWTWLAQQGKDAHKTTAFAVAVGLLVSIVILMFFFMLYFLIKVPLPDWSL